MIIRVSTEFTRPANITAYSAGDVIGPASGQSLVSLGVPYSSATVVGAHIESDATQDASPVVHIVTSSTYAPGVDNAAITAPVYGDGLVGSFGLSSLFYPRVTEGAPIADIAGTTFIPFCYPSRPVSGRLYVAVQVGAGFTPTSGQRFTVSLFVDVPQNELGRF